MNSYFNGDEYGYDQINVGSTDFNIYKSFNTNTQIDNIREREKRLLNKMNNFSSDGNLKPFATCAPSKECDKYLSSSKQTNNNHHHDHTYERNYDTHGLYPKKKDDCQYYHQNIISGNKTIFPFLKREQEGMYGGETHIGNHNIDVEKLHNQIDELDQKNNLLVIFIFFLVIAILVQYSKHNNDPLKVLMVSDNKSSDNKSSYNKSSDIDDN